MSFLTARVTTIPADVNVENTIDRADKALYEAKASGRNCIRLWQQPTSEQV